VSYSPDGKTIAVAERSGVTLYDAASGRSSASLRESPPCAVEKVQFSPDGKRLATVGVTMHGDSQGEVRIWDLKSRRVLLGFPGRTGVESPQGFPGACALTSDFRLFANAGKKTRLWQVNEEATKRS
jgi:WD40 repeat protein